MDELWYKNAVIYAVDVHRFKDSDGDGRGDFKGLTEKLGYLGHLGVTCLWLLPFYPTPGRDNGYDVKGYYDIDDRLGTFDEFVDFLHAAGERGMRVIIDLVMDHTSDQHPWFQAARRDPASRFRDYYSWAEHPPPVPPGEGNIFPGQESSVWTYDEVAGAYYYHKFYSFEPELNSANPEVQAEIQRVLDFWLSFGVAGFRIDAASHMITGHGTEETRPENPHGILKDMRSFVSARKEGTMLIGEVDEDPEKLPPFFGDGDELNMLFNFFLNNYFFLALAREEAAPIVRALAQLPAPPATGQWANFIRNLDELDLERLTEADRQEVFEAFAPEEDMQIFGRGIRRRLAPMLEGDRRRIELAFSLLFSLPGTPVFIYGDELGMGEDLSQPGREAVRAPMPWSDEEGAGFSSAPSDRLVAPVISEGPFGYGQVNVQAQLDDLDSLLHWMRNLIFTRRACPEIGYGNWHTFEVESPSVLAHRCTWKDGIVVAVHNLSGQEQHVTLDLRDQRGRQLEGLFGRGKQRLIEEGTCEIDLDAYGYEWYRIKGERLMTED